MQKKVTLGKVREACLALESQGQTISVRNIIAITGGSNSTVTPLLRQYQEQQRQELNESYPLSAEFRQAIRTEIHHAVNKSKSIVEMDLMAALENEKDLVSELKNAEDKILNLEAKLQDAIGNVEKIQKDSAHQLTIREQQISALENSMDQMTAEKTSLEQALTEHRKILAQSELLLTQAQETVQEKASVEKSLTAQCEDIKDTMSRLERDVDLANHRVETARERLEEIKGSLE